MLNIKTNDDINNLMVGGTFRLKVNLPMMPPYIYQEEFDDIHGINPNIFYLCMIKPNPNCSIVGLNNTTLNIYIDDKKCINKKLSISSQNSPYRLVLIPEKYALDTTLPFNNNINFNLINMNNNLYLLNTSLKYLPTLFKDNFYIPVNGNMINDKNSNISKIPGLINNTLVTNNDQSINLNAPTLNVNCLIEPDNELYLMTTKDITNSSPIEININNDHTINISLKNIIYMDK